MADEENSLPLKRRAATSRSTDRPQIHVLEGSHYLGDRTTTTNATVVTATGEEDNSGFSTPGMDSPSALSSSLAKDHTARVTSTTSAAASRSKFASPPASVHSRHALLRFVRSLWRRRLVYKKRLYCGVAVFVALLVLLRWLALGVSFDTFGGLSFPANNTTATDVVDDLGDAAEAALAGLQDTLLDIAAMGPQQELSGDLSRWSVLVQHEDAMQRIHLTTAQRTCLDRKRAGDAAGPCDVLRARISRTSLPSWTLNVAKPACTDCIVRRTDQKMIAAARLSSRHAVASTSHSPLGRIGPMLFAMSSVTQEIPLQKELGRWGWMRHVYEAFPSRDADTYPPTNTTNTAVTAAAAAGVRRGYLAVMGVPSTDQPARVALRDAQRATWMSYHEVARSENGFDGALLPLYLFAAAEPVQETPAPTETELIGEKAKNEVGEDPDAEMDAKISTTTTTTTTTTTINPAAAAGSQLCGRTDVLLPTVHEYQQASTLMRSLFEQVTTDNNQDGAGAGNATYTQRRVSLRSDYLTVDVSASPCRGVVESQVSASAAAQLPLPFLSAQIGWNVTPAFVSPAENICCASAALWREALTHRNVIWIDMMTDRKPTTNKKLGDTKKWGLPVEVGMSQKLILWLLYAYNSFTNVPYIIKGDDDMYVKVPQFLNDMRYLRHGVTKPRPSLPPLTTTITNLAANTQVNLNTSQPVAVHDDAASPPQDRLDNAKCLYWGSTRRMGGVFFNAGMLFLLQRRLVQALLEFPQNATDTDLLELASTNYTKSLSEVYRRTRFDKEDVLMGYTLHNRLSRVEQLCPGGKLFYVREPLSRFHDMHRGRTHSVTYRTVVAHRCRPADAYFLHYFFQKESAVAQMDLAPGEDREETAKEMTTAWVAEVRAAMEDDVEDWGDLPTVEWSRNLTTRPKSSVAENDRVPVYHVRYFSWKDLKAGVKYGYRPRSSD